MVVVRRDQIYYSIITGMVAFVTFPVQPVAFAPIIDVSFAS